MASIVSVSRRTQRHYRSSSCSRHAQEKLVLERNVTYPTIIVLAAFIFMHWHSMLYHIVKYHSLLRTSEQHQLYSYTLKAITNIQTQIILFCVRGKALHSIYSFARPKRREPPSYNHESSHHKFLLYLPQYPPIIYYTAPLSSDPEHSFRLLPLLR
jgi:hypothetical protein